jgi:hypothetical protein
VLGVQSVVLSAVLAELAQHLQAGYDKEISQKNDFFFSLLFSTAAVRVALCGTE